MKLQLQPPLKRLWINQTFGVNGDYYQSHGINIKGHNGIDFAASHGESVYASHDGYAYFEWDSSQGEGVVIRSKSSYELLDGSISYIKTIYWHLCDGEKEPQYKSPITCFDWNSQGQEVKAGDLIGYADNTGFSTGDHLHFGLKPISAGETLGGTYNPNQNNGYNGAIDPLPYLVKPVAQFIFMNDMQYGDTSDDVLQLQKRLGVIQTGFYGKLTQVAVFNYQQIHIQLSWWEYWILRGSKVGTKTRASLNSS